MKLWCISTKEMITLNKTLAFVNLLMRRVLPVITLVLLAPLVAEVLIGDLPFDVTGAVAFVTLMPIYGGGVLLIRELVRRCGRGWPSILLLGIAYGVVEEGLALQGMFSPTIYNGLGPAWGARLLGVNGVYTEVQLVNHAVWSIAIPILLTELIFPACRRQPYLGRFGLGVTSFVYLLGVGLVALSARTSLDHGYLAPPALLFGALVIVVVLGVVALAVLPRVGYAVNSGGVTTTSSWRPFFTAFAGGFFYLAVLVLPGNAHLAFMRTPFVAVPMLAALAVAMGTGLLLTRWTRTQGVDDRHALATGAGALLGHSLLWGITQPKTWQDHAVVAALIAASVLLLWLLARRVSARIKQDEERLPEKLIFTKTSIDEIMVHTYKGDDHYE